MTAVIPRKEEHGGGVSLPEDIVFDVLARLPAKDLCRFRCVSKTWRALISDPAFVAAQRSRAGPHLVGVFLLGPCHLPPEVRVMDMDGNVVRELEITRSTPQLPMRQDLICADVTGLTLDGGMIIDPAAGRAFAAFGTIDPPPWARTYAYSASSFGRATPSGVFKVLRLQNTFLMDDHGDIGHQLLCEVASISGGGTVEPLTWRQKSTPPPFVAGWRNKAVVNGVVYFTHELKNDDAAPRLNRIVAFDLESEEWKAEAINGPALGHYKEEEEIWSISLVELNGTLAFVHDVVMDTYPYMSIWLLIDPDKSVWLKEYVIPMPDNQMEPATPLGVLVDGRILLWSSVFQKEETRGNTSIGRRRELVLFYDPSTKAFTNFVELVEEFGFTLVLYTGSLLS